MVDLCEELVVPACILSPFLGPCVEMLELHSQDSSLKGIKTAVQANQTVVVLGPTPMRPQYAEAIRKVLVLTNHHTSIAEGSEVFRGIEGETPCLSHRAGWPRWMASVRLIKRTDGLGSILDHFQAMGAAQVKDGVHVGTLAKKMDRYDTPDRDSRVSMVDLPSLV